MSEVIQTSDDPTNPRTRRVLKNRQENSGNSIPFIISPMQHLQAVIVGSSKTSRFCRGEQRSEPHPRTQMSDYSTIHYFRKFCRNFVTPYFFTSSNLAENLGKKI